MILSTQRPQVSPSRCTERVLVDETTLRRCRRTQRPQASASRYTDGGAIGENEVNAKITDKMDEYAGGDAVNGNKVNDKIADKMNKAIQTLVQNSSGYFVYSKRGVLPRAPRQSSCSDLFESTQAPNLCHRVTNVSPELERIFCL